MQNWHVDLFCFVLYLRLFDRGLTPGLLTSSSLCSLRSFFFSFLFFSFLFTSQRDLGRTWYEAGERKRYGLPGNKVDHEAADRVYFRAARLGYQVAVAKCFDRGLDGREKNEEEVGAVKAVAFSLRFAIRIGIGIGIGIGMRIYSVEKRVLFGIGIDIGVGVGFLFLASPFTGVTDGVDVALSLSLSFFFLRPTN